MMKMLNITYFRDWTDVVWSLIGIVLFYWIYRGFLGYFEEKNKEKLTETERNKRIMESIEHDCSCDR